MVESSDRHRRIHTKKIRKTILFQPRPSRQTNQPPITCRENMLFDVVVVSFSAWIIYTQYIRHIKLEQDDTEFDDNDATQWTSRVVLSQKDKLVGWKSSKLFSLSTRSVPLMILSEEHATWRNRASGNNSIQVESRVESVNSHVTND